MRENGDGDDGGGGVETVVTKPVRTGDLDDDIRGMLTAAASGQGSAPLKNEGAAKWAKRILSKVKQQDPTKHGQFKTNAMEAYLKELAYAAGTFTRATRATLDPGAISNAAFSGDQRSQIINFLKATNRGSPTVRVPETIDGPGWSIKLHYDLLGPPHGNKATPHVQFAKGETKQGEQRYVGDHTRQMTFDETAMLIAAPNRNPAWAVAWAKSEVGIT